MPTRRFRVLHAEHAVTLRLRSRTADRQMQREPEYAAGIQRIDHAVVPQPRSGIVRMALRFVLPANFIHELDLLGLGPRFTAGLCAIAAHGREYLRGLLATHH